MSADTITTLAGFSRRESQTFRFSNRRVVLVYDGSIQLDDIPEYRNSHDWEIAHSYIGGHTYVIVDFKINKNRHIRDWVAKGIIPKIYCPSRPRRHSDDFQVAKDQIESYDGSIKKEPCHVGDVSSPPKRRKISRRKLYLQYDWYLTPQQVQGMFAECSSEIVQSSYYNGHTNVALNLNRDYSSINLTAEGGVEPRVKFIHDRDEWNKLGEEIIKHTYGKHNDVLIVLVALMIAIVIRLAIEVRML